MLYTNLTGGANDNSIYINVCAIGLDLLDIVFNYVAQHAVYP